MQFILMGLSLSSHKNILSRERGIRTLNKIKNIDLPKIEMDQLRITIKKTVYSMKDNEN
jgi:hypothetical protein